MRRWLIGAALVLSAGAWAEALSPVLELGDARFEGRRHAGIGVDAFLGIPFAQPPVGELRWQPPQAARYAPGKFIAHEFAPACFQGDHITRWYQGVVAGFGGDPSTIIAPPVSEDCLYLNLWRPGGSVGTALPVIVFVHGGSNRGGWSFEPNYRGGQLARRGAVVISVAYRLGPFGFFAHPQLRHANFGLLDLVEALEWVRAYVSRAGGDPSNVTVVGESSGASNISQLLAMPQAQGLFQRLIHQSAGWALREAASPESSRALGLALQSALEVGSVEAMRKLPAASVDAAAQGVYRDAGFEPVVAPSLPVALPQLLAAGKLPPVDLLIGSNADEWKMYLTPQQSLSSWLEEHLPAEKLAPARAELATLDDERRALDVAITAFNYVCPSMNLARRVSSAGGRSWMYYFSRRREGGQAQRMGAYHGAELPYLFNTHDDWLPTTRADRQLTHKLMGYWVNFARTGDPNGDGHPLWPAWSAEQGAVLQLDEPPHAVVHPSARLCAILENNSTGSET